MCHRSPRIYVLFAVVSISSFFPSSCIVFKLTYHRSFYASNTEGVLNGGSFYSIYIFV